MIYIVCFSRLFQTVGFWATMQHDPTRTLAAFVLCQRGPSLMSVSETAHQNFVETLPTEMSVKIFGELDTESLCSASRTCKLWHHIIEGNEQLWRRQCLLVRAICQREVDSDRRDGLSWKVGQFSAHISVVMCRQLLTAGKNKFICAGGQWRDQNIYEEAPSVEQAHTPRSVVWPPVSSAAGDISEELHSELSEERLAERSIQPCELSGAAERQEDDAAGRWDMGRDLAGRAGQMNCHYFKLLIFNIFYITTVHIFKIFLKKKWSWGIVAETVLTEMKHYALFRCFIALM